MDELIVKDCNGNILKDGDSVSVIKSLKVKGGGTTIKQGTTVKKIRLTDDPAEVDCKIDGMSIVLRTEFLRKK
ncbi:zinc ribbon domain-containing protein YjdM [Mucilaginibacter myungsuensis]|uniref:Alkylphosphonate utilization protein n=1 Tax=Mucilaginibacter myungsuensis TaxID=649104 RepID=A0A929KVI8_9SPHI|nr:zinc ribbon domain-containing protein YjdM [Mucilaginibacter myungsuensis]MBE9661213.1 alkylphosphonate utilization protein [Mucilaginibacter myungsuensis]MDN3597357.1 zinc ribbon domain-containing protein YjdM [Mucilaginibacter myungsuensis]